MAKIQFEDKVATKQSSKPRINCVTHDDINEIKASVNALYDGISISENEIDTGKKWVNGKTIYRKTLIFTGEDITKGITNGLKQYDISSLGAEDIFIDYNYSYFDLTFANNQNQRTNISNIAISNSAFSTTRNQSSVITGYNNTTIAMYIGDTKKQNIQTSVTAKLYITLEYTKTS